MNSIIEAQIELKEQIDLEFKKCKEDPYYFFLNHWLVNNKLVEFPKRNVTTITIQSFN